jgi:hypothetical protein
MITKLKNLFGIRTSQKDIVSSKPQRNTKTIYRPLTKHIYHNGTSYRVRVIKNGVKHSKNFVDEREARLYRERLLNL